MGFPACGRAEAPRRNGPEAWLVAAECGAPAPDDADPVDSLEDVLEAHLQPYGDAESPEDGKGEGLP